jgi:hypothetical protein
VQLSDREEYDFAMVVERRGEALLNALAAVMIVYLWCHSMELQVGQ